MRHSLLQLYALISKKSLLERELSKDFEPGRPKDC